MATFSTEPNPSRCAGATSVMAASVGLGRLAQEKARAPALAALALVLGALAGQMIRGATPLSLSWSSGPYRMDRDEGTLCWYARSIREHDGVSVMAPAAVIGHLAERERVHSWAFDHPQPDVAILDLSQRQWVQLEPARWDEPMEREIQSVRLDARGIDLYEQLILRKYDF